MKHKQEQAVSLSGSANIPSPTNGENAISPSLAAKIEELQQAQLTDSDRNFAYLRFFSSNEPLHAVQHQEFLQKYGLSNIFKTVYRVMSNDELSVAYDIPDRPEFQVVQERCAHPLEVVTYDDRYSLVPGVVHGYMYKLYMTDPDA